MASTRPDEPLVPPAVCCGREFRVRRALEAHERSHGACGEAGCTFAGSRAALRLHAWEAHGIGSAPKTAPVRGGSTLHDELCAGRAGNEFRIVDELAAEAVPLEVRFPGADIVWMHDDAAEAGALGPAEDGADDEWPREADGHSSAVLPWPAGCRILMIVGATGSNKTRLLGSARWVRGLAPQPAALVGGPLDPRRPGSRRRPLAQRRRARLRAALEAAPRGAVDRRSLPVRARVAAAVGRDQWAAARHGARPEG